MGNTITIEVPEGKTAKWVNGVLTLVEEPPVEFRFNYDDKVRFKGSYKELAIYRREAVNGKPHYWLKDEDGVPYPNHSESEIELYTEPKNITDRIKTLTDAYNWCFDNNHGDLCRAYTACSQIIDSNKDKDIIAYLKLRIITCALNEGWEPKFEKGELRWYAWYDFLTNAELDEMKEEEIKECGICRVVGRAHDSASAVGGLVYSGASSVSSYSYAVHGSRLAFKSEELAEYAAKQFIEIYAYYCFTQK